ncbi:MAG: L-fucose mutarotase [Chitinivibrionales bacterium]|nr:L-fucose mutarotase [Chitinivibrionales bacterium]
MLRGISPVVSPEMLSVLYRMGHGDEIVLADAHFPGETYNHRIVRADGITIPDLLAGILPLFVLDEYVDAPVIMMLAVEGDTPDPAVEKSYVNVINNQYPHTPAPLRMERFAFYHRAQEAFAVIMSGDTAKYGNVIIKKGVTPVV